MPQSINSREYSFTCATTRNNPVHALHRYAPPSPTRAFRSSADKSDTAGKDNTGFFEAANLMVRRARAYTHLRDALTLCLQLLGACNEKSSPTMC